MSPTFQKIQPSLPVTSIPESIAYYTKTLGFSIAGRDRDDHTWLYLPTDEKNEDAQKAAVNLYLRRRTFPSIPNDVQFGKVHIRISGDDDELERLLKKFEAAGAKVLRGVEFQPWGLKDFEVTDLDGNILNFDQAIPGWRPPG
ncbi:uncharacterized protein MYCFIDRAFT_212277 [Pseudocercospora fijiensis CIRAD86]|uniref:VOC domain-containing protein n=1 Tax=Pseudocercospora fijiensis (strain CIRAD86) TaxID=383855 RepID=M3AQF1_PSEFD|nr:uncharacterized protein MYCFIDRAFT_212277 [Pseudocercospora fijiensis CIRAD86]EME79657.1 hypothetical protein MYCFIDRAFT_212277 [Pseudocercospora fijiensis CIRAD86]